MTRPLNCIIIDDEPLARQLLKSYVDKTPSLSLAGSFGSASEAMKCVMEGNADIVFLDINMPLLNGIEFASIIPQTTRIIFVTAYEQYALQGFRVNALDYLLKPVSYADFMRSVGKAIEWFSMVETSASAARPLSGTIAVKADYKVIQMDLDSIMYIEVRKDRVIFNRSQGQPVSSLMSMKELEERLPADRFMRVHRSFIVNLRKVEVVERGRIVFGKDYIPISDNRRDEFFARLGN